MANDSIYGLAAGVFTGPFCFFSASEDFATDSLCAAGDAKQAMRVSGELSAGSASFSLSSRERGGSADPPSLSVVMQDKGLTLLPAQPSGSTSTTSSRTPFRSAACANPASVANSVLRVSRSTSVSPIHRPRSVAWLLERDCPRKVLPMLTTPRHSPHSDQVCTPQHQRGPVRLASFDTSVQLVRNADA